MPATRMLSARTWQLLYLLADGEFHSGAVLAKQLGLSPASIFNALAGVADSGIALQRIRGRGYRLARSWQRLEQAEVIRWLGKEASQFDIEILPQAASSNTVLLQRAASDIPVTNTRSGSVVAVELQTAGRGRRGRSWHSGLGTALTFSLLWRFEGGLNALSGLSLAAGVAIMRALVKCGAQGAQLKWPNDVMTRHGKLAGVLIEAQGDMLGPSAAVIGIGLNYTLPASLAPQIGQPACGLDEICTTLPSRNQLLAMVLQELALVLRQFAQQGFAPLRKEWERYHGHQDKEIRLIMANGQVEEGIARGVNDNGELCLETLSGVRHFNGGEVGAQQ